MKLLVVIIICGFQNIPDLPTPKRIKVGVSEFSPCVIVEGEYVSGHDWDIFLHICHQMNLSPQLTIYRDLDELLFAVENKEVEVGVAGSFITSNRLEKVQFSQPYASGGLRMMTKKKPSSLESIVRNKLYQFWRPDILSSFVLLLFNFICFGVVVFLSERKHKDSNIKGVYEGTQAAADIGTTIGFGRHFPVTKTGNVLAIVCFLFSTLIIGDLVATIATHKIVKAEDSLIQSPKDLKGKKVGVVESGASGDIVYRYDPTSIKKSGDFSVSVADLLLGKVDVVVSDSVVVEHYVKNNPDELQFAGKVFNPSNYGFMFPIESNGMDRSFSQEIMNMRNSGDLEKIRLQWFGDSNEHQNVSN